MQEERGIQEEVKITKLPPGEAAGSEPERPFTHSYKSVDSNGNIRSLLPGLNYYDEKEDRFTEVKHQRRGK